VQDRQLSSRDLITGLCVVTKRMDTCCPWIVANNPRAPYWFDGPAHDGNERYSLATLVRASTAAPHFFDPEMFAISKDEEGLFIDGGVTPFNNPSLALFQMATFQPFGICWPTGPDKLTVTSVGTGTYRPLFSYRRRARQARGRQAGQARALARGFAEIRHGTGGRARRQLSAHGKLIVAESFRSDAGERHNLAPLRGFVGDEPAEIGWRARQHLAPQVGEPSLDLGIGEARIDLLVQPVNDCGWRGLGGADSEGGACLKARHEIPDRGEIGQHLRARHGGYRQRAQAAGLDVFER
jgi:hypothetical protein